MDDDDKVFQCYECADGVQIFATEEALITHKWDMIRASRRKSHMCCHVCKLDHRTFEGLVRHYQLNHPVKQKLNCPGCNAVFSRLHLLMHHLDGDCCPHILASRVSENRVLQVQATNLVAAAAVKGAIEGGTEDGLAVPSEARLGARLEDAERFALLGIQDSSGVTIGDFGRFVGIDPQTAAAAVGYETAAAAAAAVGGQGWGLSVGLGGQFPRNRLDQDNAVAFSKEDQPPGSSKEAMLKMMAQRRQLKDAEAVRKDKGKGKAIENINGNPGEGSETDKEKQHRLMMERAARDFRRGDSKAPDLLTDDVAAMNQRFQNLNVWAGQAMLEAEPVRQGGPVCGLSRVPQAAQMPRTTQDSTQRGLGSGLSSVMDSVRQPPLNVMAASAGGYTTNNVSQYIPHALPDVHHPDHPRFNIYRYKNKINGRFHCPHTMCQRAGKQFKTTGSLMGHLRNDAAHSTLRVQCPSCFGYFTSVNALTQHCESQSSRCQFRESDDYLPFLNILTAGVAEVQDRNIDMTLAYNVQPTAAQALLQDEVWQGDHCVEQSEMHEALSTEEHHHALL
ncbi:hypothetical protein SEUCBS140593_006935 [Sporothrix eucalyptigena]|uniref:C2H2-type domain-containing protein n=1 Tax=Sporothrix eucalyptigena TaxID=1812306 RepID=A0ABP0CB73_9PEZI